MATLDLVGGRYVLYLHGRVTHVPCLGGQGLTTQSAMGYGAIAERTSPLAQWKVRSRFSFMTVGGIGLDPEHFFVADPFETLCDGTSMEEVARWLRKPPTLLVDAICAAKLDEIAAWEAEKLAQCGGEPYRLPPACTVTFGPIGQKIIEIGFSRRDPTHHYPVFEER